MKSIKQLVLVVIWASLLLSFANAINDNASSSSDFKHFPEYGCSLRLPDMSSWQWSNPTNGPENTIAFASSKDGVSFMLVAEQHGQTITLSDKLISEYDKEVTGKPNLRKISGKTIEFMDVSAYELNFAQIDTKAKAFSRMFTKGKMEYGLIVMVPKGVPFSRSMLEQIYGGFSWSELLESPQKQDHSGNVTFYGPSDYKTFPQYHCKLRLPDKKTWKWTEPEEEVASAESEDGIKMMLIVLPPVNSERLVLNDKFIIGFERGVLSKGFKKENGQKIVYNGVQAYQLTMSSEQLSISFYSRVFIKHNKTYMLSFLIPVNLSVSESKMDLMYTCFSWMLTPEEIAKQSQSEKEALMKSYVFKENTLPDTTNYAVSDAKMHQFKKGEYTFQIDISANEIVDNRSKPTTVFYNIKAQDSANAFTQGYTTNIPVRVEAYMLKQDIEDAVKECKENMDNQQDTLLVKEYKELKADNPEAVLLFVSTFSDNEPCVYKGMQFVQYGEYVLTIKADCAQAMQMSQEYKTLLNNIVQTSLKSIRVNGKPVDTKILAKHVKKS